LVIMASYAPLFCRVDQYQWQPNAINYDSYRVYGTPSYWNQVLFSQYSGVYVFDEDDFELFATNSTDGNSTDTSTGSDSSTGEGTGSGSGNVTWKNCSHDGQWYGVLSREAIDQGPQAEHFSWVLTTVKLKEGVFSPLTFPISNFLDAMAGLYELDCRSQVGVNNVTFGFFDGTNYGSGIEFYLEVASADVKKFSDKIIASLNDTSSKTSNTEFEQAFWNLQPPLKWKFDTHPLVAPTEFLSKSQRVDCVYTKEACDPCISETIQSVAITLTTVASGGGLACPNYTQQDVLCTRSCAAITEDTIVGMVFFTLAGFLLLFVLICCLCRDPDKARHLSKKEKPVITLKGNEAKSNYIDIHEMADLRPLEHVPDEGSEDDQAGSYGDGQYSSDKDASSSEEEAAPEKTEGETDDIFQRKTVQIHM